MFQKNIFKILILCMALAQLPFGSFGQSKFCRFPNDYTLRQPSEDDKKLPAVTQLEKSILDASINLHFLITLKSKNIFEAVIKELQTMPNTESAVQDFQSKLLDFEKQHKPCETIQSVLNIASIYTEIMEHYPLKLQESENDDIKLIVNVLKNFDAYNYRSTFQTEVAEYIKIFEDKYQELKEPIKRENEEFSYELNKWFEEVYNKRNDLFYKLDRISKHLVFR